MTRLCRHFLISLTLALLTAGAFAQTTSAPPLMNFQGRLAKPDGTPVSDGTRSIRFSLWDAVTGGTEKWNQTVATVNVRNGVFAVLLNVNTPNLFDADLWLEIKIGNDTPLAPRQQLLTVAYAFKANTVPDGAITTAKINSSGAASGQSLMFNGSSVVWGNPKASDLLLPFAASTSSSGPAFSITNTGSHAGIYGYSDGIAGVYGRSPTHKAIWGDTDSGWGVIGFSGTGTGVEGNSNSGIGIHGASVNGLAGQFDGPLYVNGNVGIGTSAPIAPLHIVGNNPFPHLKIEAGSNAPYGAFISMDATALSGGKNYHIFTTGGNSVGAIGQGKLVFQNYTDNINHLTLDGTGKVGIGTTFPTARLHVLGNAYIENGFGGTPTVTLAIGDTDTGFNWAGDGMLDVYANNVNTMQVRSGSVNVNGTMSAHEVDVTGSDVAEPYHVASSGNVKPIAGIVVALDPHKSGRLQVARTPYDKTVAGIISGANGIRPGILLRQPGTLADGDWPVASTGRVYCWCDADVNGAIQIGDLLTTSNTPGHAMKVSNYNKARGAILGKAMSPLKKGKGLVLVLVTLQ